MNHREITVLELATHLVETNGLTLDQAITAVTSFMSNIQSLADSSEDGEADLWTLEDYIDADAS